MRLPEPLTTDSDDQAVAHLRRYYGGYTGRFYDERPDDGRDAFTAEDVVAVSYLSVHIPGASARELLVDRRDEFAELIAAVGEDRDLVDVGEAIDASWPGRVLKERLGDLPGVGPVTSSKLCARVRPRLLPIWDSVIAQVTGARRDYWEPLRLQLRADDRYLQHRLERLRESAGLSAEVSAIRVFDVVAWMHGTHGGRDTPPEVVGG